MHLDMTFTLEVADAGLEFIQTTGDEAIYVPYQELTALEISGPGTTTTNGGFRGGGFGVEGAAVGMIAAGILNFATKRTSTNTFLRVATYEEEAFFHTRDIEPIDLRMLLSPAVVKLEAQLLRHSASMLAGELERLHHLFQRGALTDEEYSNAKRKAIGIVTT